jgi:putative transcriptional regulator
MGEPLTDLRNRLRLWRASHGLTQEELADLVGCSPSMISRAERGERVFSPMRKVQVARRLDARVSDLFELDEISDGDDGP